MGAAAHNTPIKPLQLGSVKDQSLWVEEGPPPPAPTFTTVGACYCRQYVSKHGVPNIDFFKSSYVAYMVLRQPATVRCRFYIQT